MKYRDLQYLTLSLPEAVQKERGRGNFDGARQAIDRILADKDTGYPLACRLELERNNLNYIQARYTVSEEKALETLRTRIPDFTMEELDSLRREEKADWMYINGEVRFIDCFDATLFKVYPELWNRTQEGDKSDYSILENLVSNLENGQDMIAHIHIRQDLIVKEEAVREGEKLYVHMPIPRQRGTVENFKLINVSPECNKQAADDEWQPTVYFESAVPASRTFSIEYSLDNKTRYMDMSQVDQMAVAKATIPETEKRFLQEELPHILFTPYLKALAKEIAGDETNPLLTARKIYDFITVKTDYRFVRDYCSIDNLPEYGALNRRGDCGVQALLFITLCRIMGIPAKWQSGLDAKPSDVGEHDWALFYVPSVGWVYADLSYGGSSYLRGAMKRWDFYFGNIDPYRIPINDGFQQEFVPVKKHWRIDPYDNQCGEAEYADRGLTAEEVDYKYVEIEIK